MNVNGLQKTGMGTKEFDKDSTINAWHSQLAHDQWVAFPVSGVRPLARCKHAAVVVQEKLYVTGGSHNGRHLSDIQVFDLRTLTWSVVRLHMDPSHDEVAENSSKENLPAYSGHSLVQWGSKLLAVAGHLKESSDTVIVRSIDVETNHCYIVKTSGKVPIARGGQSVTLIGSRLIMFGGEDRRRRLLNDLHILDLETVTWDVVETMQAPPAPRFDHTAAVHSERYLLIFGGCSHSTCFSDLHVLDLHTMEWSQPQIQGEVVMPRAGHAGTTIDDKWYIVGGGDNKSGATETLVLNMSRLVWSIMTSVKERDPLASEGLSLCSTSMDGEKFLVAFGGYNGKYNNEVFVLKPKRSDSSQPKIFHSPAAAAAAASVTAVYALAPPTENNLVFTNTDANFKEVETEKSPQDGSAEIEAITALESKIAEVRLENSRIQGDLNEMNNTHSELSKELHSVQGQVEGERSRCFKLEVQITELQKRLESLQSIEHELEVLRLQKSVSEKDTELAAADANQSQRSGGIWQWVAGGT